MLLLELHENHSRTMESRGVCGGKRRENNKILMIIFSRILYVPYDRFCHELQFVFSSSFCISKVSMCNLSVKTTGPVAPESVTVSVAD